MQIEPQAIPEVLLITPRRFSDSRGFVSETFRQSRLAAAGIAYPFVQDNHTFSRAAGTVRGLHAQAPPPRRASSSASSGAPSGTLRST